MKRALRALLASLLTVLSVSAAEPITVAQGNFIRAGKPHIIRSAELNYARIPQAYWSHRLAQVRAAGFNTVSTYVIWALHERQPGVFTWSGDHDLVAFCRAAEQQGLDVVVRPGPYLCGEWDLGGYPWWLLQNANRRDRFLRTTQPRHLEAAERWLEAVGRQLAPLSAKRGGPIILAQIENEYAAYGREAGYTKRLATALERGGLDVPVYDLEAPSRVRAGDPDIIGSVALGSDPRSGIEALRRARPGNPAWVGEFYPGWFDSWGKPRARAQRDRFLADLRWMVTNHVSFNLYVLHGGTTFGPWAGSNSPPFSPQITSYDFDAPIDEQGQLTPLYHEIRKLLAAHQPAGTLLPEPPAPISIQRLARTPAAASTSLMANLPRGRNLPLGARLNFEALGLGYGAAVYSATVPAGPADILKLQAVHDLAWVLMEGRLVGKIDRRRGDTLVGLPARDRPARLDVLVESMGRINFGPDLHDLKGLGAAWLVDAAGKERALERWTFYPVPLDGPPPAPLRWGNNETRGPAWWGATLQAQAGKDTWLDMRGWSKGMAWINGRSLGRYWSIGPTQTLWVPGCWLREGPNEIVVLDLEGPTSPWFEGLDHAILDELRTENLPPPNRKVGQDVRLADHPPEVTAELRAGAEPQLINLPVPARGRFLALEARASFEGQSYTSLAELDLIDAEGATLPRRAWRIVFATSEERVAENGLADNILDGKPETFWHTRWRGEAPAHPHVVVIDLGSVIEVHSVRLTPRPDFINGRIREVRLHVSERPFKGQ